jgi:methylated-DNA-[protein]-cysteine S-methyltransferase
MSTIVHLQYYASPCGEIVLASVEDKLCLCDWNERPCAEKNMRRLVRLLNAEFVEETSAVLERAKIQLDEYFARSRKTFDLPLHLVGTDFQKRVWNALLEIPYGETRSYKEIALKVDNLKGVRAVAQAIGANGICIIIPCHRVVGSDHSLTGFAGGLEVKRVLLGIER